MPRRSPRGHPAPTTSPKSNLNVKAASVPFHKDRSLFNFVISALELNGRWRKGLFGGDAKPFDRSRHVYYMEMARALFSRHEEHSEDYQRHPAAYAKALMEHIERLPNILVGRQTRSQAKTVPLQSRLCWRLIRAKATRASGAYIFPTWSYTLPTDIQREIALWAICDPKNDLGVATGRIDLSFASSLRTVNSAWCSFVTPLMFSRVFIRDRRRYAQLFEYPDPGSVEIGRHAPPVCYTDTFVIEALPEHQDVVHIISSSIYHRFARLRCVELDSAKLERQFELLALPTEISPGIPAPVDSNMSWAKETSSYIGFALAWLKAPQIVVIPRPVKRNNNTIEKPSSIGIALCATLHKFDRLDINATEYSTLTTDTPGEAEETNGYRIDYLTDPTQSIVMPMSGRQIIVHSHCVGSLLTASMLLMKTEVQELLLVGWDAPPDDNEKSKSASDSSDYNDWLALVERERLMTVAPAWDPKGRIRWLDKDEYAELERMREQKTAERVARNVVTMRRQVCTQHFTLL